MHPQLSKLLSIASDAIGNHTSDSALRDYFARWGKIGLELAKVLVVRNGFWVFESSLLVRPLEHDRFPLGVQEWNKHELWKHAYNDDLSSVLFFAEDAFGGQFGICHNTIRLFDPETAQSEEIAGSLVDWASVVSQDYEFRTGYPLSHSWQVQHGPLQPGTRLLPKVPFVLGGQFEVDNLYSVSDVDGMLFRATIANQIKEIPDGCQVAIEIVNRPKGTTSNS